MSLEFDSAVVKVVAQGPRLRVDQERAWERVCFVQPQKGLFVCF